MLSTATYLLCILAAAVTGLVFVTAWRELAVRRAVFVRFNGLLEKDDLPEGMTGQLFDWLERFGRKFGASSVTPELRNLIARAGYFDSSAIYIFVSIRILCAIGIALASWSIIEKSGGFSVPRTILFIIIVFFALRLPAIVLKIRIEARAREIRKELPAVLDIILMALESGVSIDQCLRYVPSVLFASSPATTIVINKYIHEVDSGLPYDAAFDRLGQRLGIDEGQDFAALIKQGLFQGGELSSTLRRFASELVDKRLSRAREIVARKAIHLTIVMLLFFMPVLLVVLAGPAVTGLWEVLSAVESDVKTNKAPR